MRCINVYKMHKIYFDVYFANGIAIDVTKAVRVVK